MSKERQEPSRAVIEASPPAAALASSALTPEQVDLIKRTVCKGATNDELRLFLQQCARTGLDPFSRQIHAVKRWSFEEQREVMTIQVGIDGYRLIADRTGCYLPGRAATYEYDGEGQLYAATAYVQKYAHGGWHEVGRTAHYVEFVQTKKDGTPTKFWARMPHLMLAKVAEAHALRAAFPHELSGIYTHEEMGGEGGPASNDRRALPPPAPSLYDRICAFERRLVEQGRCQTGELTAWLSQEGGRAFGSEVQTWPDSASDFCAQACRQFAEDHPSRQLTAEQLAALRQELLRTGETWTSLATALGLPGGSKLGQLNREAYEEAMVRLGEMADAEVSDGQ